MQINIDLKFNTLNVKVDFDISITLIANTLYKILAGQFKLFDKAKPKTVYRNIIEGAAKIYIDSENIKVVFSKKAFNPLIMDWINSINKIKVPWMGNRIMQYDFE